GVSVTASSCLPASARLLFFFQAEDGIRDRNVTGVQTCALPISHSYQERMIRLSRNVRGVRCLGSVALELCEVAAGRADLFVTMRSSPWDHNAARIILEEAGGAVFTEIGRASCRERGERRRGAVR